MKEDKGKKNSSNFKLRKNYRETKTNKGILGKILALELN